MVQKRKMTMGEYYKKYIAYTNTTTARRQITFTANDELARKITEIARQKDLTTGQLCRSLIVTGILSYDIDMIAMPIIAIEIEGEGDE